MSTQSIFTLYKIYILYKYCTGAKLVHLLIKYIIKKQYNEYNKSEQLDFTTVSITTIFLNIKDYYQYFMTLFRETSQLQIYLWEEMERMLQSQCELLHSPTALCPPI